jgi:NAD-dependent dihydropyrimidine dehydrogenase PreA subunit
MSVMIDITKCTGCGTCTGICPQNAIRVLDNLAVVDRNLCVECGRCVPACPSGAIDLVSPARLAYPKNVDRMSGYGRRPDFRYSSLLRPNMGRIKGGIAYRWRPGLRGIRQPLPASPVPARGDELKALKKQSDQARRQLAEIEARIRRLSHK